jgi:hypothetical protein
MHALSGAPGCGEVKPSCMTYTRSISDVGRGMGWQRAVEEQGHGWVVGSQRVRPVVAGSPAVGTASKATVQLAASTCTSCIVALFVGG